MDSGFFKQYVFQENTWLVHWNKRLSVSVRDMFIALKIKMLMRTKMFKAQ